MSKAFSFKQVARAGRETGEVEQAGKEDDAGRGRPVLPPGECGAGSGGDGGDDGGDGDALFGGTGEAACGVGGDDEEGDDEEQAEKLRHEADKEAEEEQEDEVVKRAFRKFGAGDVGAQRHEDEGLPEDAQDGEGDEGEDEDEDEVLRLRGEDVAEEVGGEVGADVFEAGDDDVACGEGEMGEAAEDGVTVAAGVAAQEVEHEDDGKGNDPDADVGGDAEEQAGGDAEQGAVRHGFAEIDEASPAEQVAERCGGKGGDEGGEPGNEDEGDDGRHGDFFSWKSAFGDKFSQ